MMKRILLALLLTLIASPALAHPALKATVPADKAVISKAPQEISIDFNGGIRLTRVTLTHAGAGTELDLDGFSGFLTDYAIPMQPAGSGTYDVEWRGLGDDGHPVIGTFSFTVAP